MLPLLMAKRDQAYPDPLQFKKDDEFLYAAKAASIFKKVVAEIIDMVDQQIAMAKHLQDKRDDKIKDKFTLEGGEK